MTWKKMETAPKDGSYILIKRDNTSGMHLSPAVVKWVVMPILGSKARETKGWWRLDDTGSAMLGKPIGWMSVPE